METSPHNENLTRKNERTRSSWNDSYEKTRAMRCALCSVYSAHIDHSLCVRACSAALQSMCSLHIYQPVIYGSRTVWKIKSNKNDNERLEKRRMLAANCLSTFLRRRRPLVHLVQFYSHQFKLKRRCNRSSVVRCRERVVYSGVR